jgi:hypothetical protein
MTSTEKQTIKVYPGFKLNPCDRKCESSPKIGTSWWKQFGYNSACLCLEDRINLEYYKNHWEFCLQGLPDDSVSNVEIYNKSGLNLMAESFKKPNDSKNDYSFVLAHHSDDDSDYGDICNACGELQDVDDETFIVGNFTVCLKCYDSDDDYDRCGETGREFDLRNPVKGCGKTITEDDENIMLGNISFCGECGENAIDNSDDDSDDECFIQYRKEIEAGCPEGHKTIWDSYGFRYEK